ncbi:SCO family protein [Acidicapsa acidisoli]|uniref:SCO family protein n=1 Tax=Acidicapsa acidisoli TaxID=1615681 RepID=UPI0021E026F1|nr:SCO family protein [Acidicapsa acidisoli]
MKRRGMEKRAALIVLSVLLTSAQIRAVEEHPARGIVVEAAPAHHSFVVSCDAIAGYMDAMEMSFSVRDAKVLVPLKPGMAVNFTIVTRGKVLYAENIQPTTTSNFESEPMEAGTLTALNSVLDPSANKRVVSVGEQVPDFELTDQARQQIRLSQFRGKVVALTFGYSRCPNPNYCYRLSNNLAQVARRLHDRAGRDLVLLTIAIDPEHDQGAALTEYANTWKADPEIWHFLTGTVAQVKQVAGMFGMNFWSSEGLLTHTLHTIIIDREGRLAVNLEGNQFTSRQLSDLVEALINRP